MRRLFSTVGIMAIALVSTAAVGLDEPDAGVELFKANKCTGCHVVTDAGIIRESGPPGIELSGVGSKFEAETIAKFITKKVELNDFEHPKKFKGSDDELKVLTEWLAGLKTK